MKMMVLKIDSDTDFDLLPEITQKAIGEIAAQWAEGTLVGTKVYRKKRLILIMSKVTDAEMTDFLTNGYPTIDPDTGDTVMNALGLNWEVMAYEDTPITKTQQTAILRYYNKNPVVDPDTGEVTGSKIVSDLTGRLQVFSGKQWVYE